jgi:hypothetical protein
MSVSGTVEEAAGWPEAIALILWAIVALVVCWGIYEIVQGVEGAGGAIASAWAWIQGLWGGSSGGSSGATGDNGSTNDNGDGSGLQGTSPDTTSGY